MVQDEVRSFGVKRRVRDRSIQIERDGAEMGGKLNIYRKEADRGMDDGWSDDGDWKEAC